MRRRGLRTNAENNLKNFFVHSAVPHFHQSTMARPTPSKPPHHRQHELSQWKEQVTVVGKCASNDPFLAVPMILLTQLWG